MNDKSKHFFACAAIAIITLLILLLFGTSWNGYEKMLAIAMGVAAAGIKEIVWDKWLRKGAPDYYDFFAGVCGAFAGMFAWVIIETFIQMI